MAPERPTPTGPAAPRADHRRVARLPGWQRLVLHPAIHLVLDLGVLEGYLTDTLDGFTDRLIELLPGLENHTCSRGVKGGFIERLREGTWPGHVTEHVALQLQQERAMTSARQDPGRQGRSRPLQRHLRLCRRDRRHRCGHPRCPPRQPLPAGRGGLRLQEEIDPSRAAPSAPRSAPRPLPSSRRRSAGTSPTSG